MRVASRPRPASALQIVAGGAILPLLLTLPLQAQQQPATQPTRAQQPTQQDAAAALQRAIQEAQAAFQHGLKAPPGPLAERYFTKAYGLWGRIHAYVPEAPEAALWMAECLRRMGRLHDAIDPYQEFIRNPRRPMVGDPGLLGSLAHKGLGQVYLELGFFNMARNEFGLALKLNPSDAETNKLMASCLLQLAELDEALEYAKLAVSADPQDPDVHRCLAQIQLKREEYAAADSASKTAAAMAYRRFEQHRTDPAAMAEYAEYMSFRAQVIRAYLQRKPPDPDAPPDPVELIVELLDRLTNLAILQQLMSQHQALAAARAFAAQYPDEVRLLESVADLEFRLRLPEQGVETARRILQLSPGNARAQQWLNQFGASVAETQPASAPPASPGPEGESQPSPAETDNPRPPAG